MKIIFVPSSFLPVLGGLQEAVYQLAKEFKLQGHNVLVLTNKYPRHLKKHEQIDGIEVARMLFPGFYLPSFNPYRIIKFIFGLLVGVINFCRLILLLKKFNPDVVNIHFLGSQAPFAMLASSLLGLRCVVSLHGDDVEGLPHRSKIDRWLFQRLLHSADHVTTCSKYLLNEAEKLAPEIKTKATAIGNGIRLEEFQDIESYKYPRPYIFAAGRLVYKKGFDVLLRAYRRLLDEGQKIDFILAGDGPEKENLINIAETLELPIAIKGERTHRSKDTNRVFFWGKADRDEMKSLMKGSDLFVIPSRKEPFGIVALEALASGKKIVASNTGGLAEIVHGRADGYIVEPENAEDLARVIQLALEDQSKKNLLDLKKSTWSEVLYRYINIF